MKILVVDIGGSHIKCAASDDQGPVRFKSGPKMTPERMMQDIFKATEGWHYDAVAIGYPGVVSHGRIVREPYHLATGWTTFDFEKTFARPVRIVNDAAMQALGSYEGGKMLFLGLGTGLGSALIVDGVLLAMELGHLHYAKHRNYEDFIGEPARLRMGNRKWSRKVGKVVDGFSKALLPDYVMIGGGNVANLDPFPDGARRGANDRAFAGGFRLWDSKLRTVKAAPGIDDSGAADVSKHGRAATIAARRSSR